MIRVPVNPFIDLSSITGMRREFDRYAREVAKDPTYGSRRAIRAQRQKEYYEKLRKQQEKEILDEETRLANNP
jgi:hypothetical protein